MTSTLTYVFVGLTFALYLFIGWISRVRESGGFYVAGRGVPAVANGAATAADWMSAASFISMAGLISVMGSDGSMYLLGWTGGYVLLALLLAPYLRKFGKYTVPDFVGARYYSETARVVAAICAIFVSFTYVAGQMRGVGIVFSRFLEVDITMGVGIGMVIVAFFAVLGGMKGITWTQVVQFFVLILAFVIPAIAISNMLTGTSIPQVGMTFSEIDSETRNGIADTLNALQTDLGFQEYTAPFTGKSNKLNVFCITFALMVGTAGLPHVIVRFYTVPNVRAARFSAGWALLFIAILYTTAPALAMFARYNLLESLHGAEIVKVERENIDDDEELEDIYFLQQANKEGEMQPINWVLTWQRSGLVAFSEDGFDLDENNKRIQKPYGDKTAGTISLANEGGEFREARIDKDIIVLSTPEVANLSPWVIALVATGGLAAALSTAAGLLLVISSSVAHDLLIHFYVRFSKKEVSEKNRVNIGRLMIIFAIIVAGYFGVNPPGFVGEVVAFAFGLAAASFFPIILLGIFDKRTNREGAIAGMVIGLLFTGGYIMGCTADKIIPFVDQPFFGPWCFGISPQGIGTVGCLLNFIVTITVSHLTPAPPKEIQDLVDSVRSPVNHLTPTEETNEANPH